MIIADTGAIRSSGTSYATAAQDGISAAQATASAGHALGTSIDEGEVSSALATAMIKILDQLKLVGGGAAYAAEHLAGSADDYDAVDTTVSGRMSGVLPGGGAQ